VTNKTYDRLKFVAMVVLPAVATLYLTLSALWGLPHPQEIAGTITAVNVFLGALLGISSANYNPSTDGVLNVDDKTGDIYAALKEQPVDIEAPSVTLEVKHV
jgi:hypothetical protein